MLRVRRVQGQGLRTLQPCTWTMISGRRQTLLTPPPCCMTLRWPGAWPNRQLVLAQEQEQGHLRLLLVLLQAGRQRQRGGLAQPQLQRAEAHVGTLLPPHLTTRGTTVMWTCLLLLPWMGTRCPTSCSRLTMQGWQLPLLLLLLPEAQAAMQQQQVVLTGILRRLQRQLWRL